MNIVSILFPKEKLEEEDWARPSPAFPAPEVKQTYNVRGTPAVGGAAQVNSLTVTVSK
jgi:hypothetical protein